MKPLSLGRQELATVVGDGCIYVDKTRHVYDGRVDSARACW